MSVQSHSAENNHEIIKESVMDITSILNSKYKISKKSIALLLIQNDEETLGLVKAKEPLESYINIVNIINRLNKNLDASVDYILAIQRKNKVDGLLDGIIKNNQQKGSGYFKDLIDKLTINPLSGFVILALVLYFGLYKLVGQFGAGTLVNLIEEKLFAQIINPFINSIIAAYIPWKPLQNLLGNEYGIFTMGISYAVAIVLPIVTVFFFVFAIIEDSGYLPRLALLIDFIFKKIGLSGRAVIPMTLGFGCDTMATMVSRTLETNKERIISTLLLALAIPCSAQLGVILAILSAHPGALLIWSGFMLFVFLFIGYLTSKVLPGSKPSFYMEVPPLRIPSIKNILSKTYTRIYWYFKEIFPLFILASILIWVGNITGIFNWLVDQLQPVMQTLGLPDKMAEIFLFGFFRRDYGAAGLYSLQQSGLLNGVQLVVATSALTLFIPCIAQFLMMIKERGLKTALSIAIFIFPFAFICGYVLNKILTFWGVVL